MLVNDLLLKHRVIGIRHCLKEIKEAGLISNGATHPKDAVNELKRLQRRSQSARRYRKAYRTTEIATITKRIADVFSLPVDSIRLIYPTGRKAHSNATVGSLRDRWEVEQ